MGIWNWESGISQISPISPGEGRAAKDLCYRGIEVVLGNPGDGRIDWPRLWKTTEVPSDPWMPRNERAQGTRTKSAARLRHLRIRLAVHANDEQTARRAGVQRVDPVAFSVQRTERASQLPSGGRGHPPRGAVDNDKRR